MLKIIIVEDDKFFRKSMEMALGQYGAIQTAGNLNDAMALLDDGVFDVGFFDLNLGLTDVDGIELIKMAKQKGITSIALTSNEDREVIRNAYDAGCSHYFGKLDFDTQVDQRIGAFLKNLDSRDWEKVFKNEFVTQDDFLISRLKHLREQIINYDQKVLITGPSGVGKSRVAKIIHKMTMDNAPFVHVNLSELSESMIESELFGHKKGAFTGATSDKKGLLEKANGGTLFLDEIGTLSLNLQKKLLRVIEEKTFSPVGSTEVIRSDYRLITATCDDLGKLVESEKFRVDFYFRIKGIEVNIPALKERRKDIPLLMDYFFNLSPRKIVLNHDAELSLCSYDWYGNVRELENLVKELINTSKGIISKSDLPRHIVNNVNPLMSDSHFSEGWLNSEMKKYIEEFGLPALVQEIEKESLATTFLECKGKTNEITRRLKISKSLYYRILNEIKDKLPSF